MFDDKQRLIICNGKKICGDVMDLMSS